jgi:hypothetical protein
MRKFLITYFFFLVFLLSFFVSGAVDSQDGFQYLAVARNIYYTGRPTAPPYEFTGGPGVGKNIHMSTHVGKDGKTYSATGLGYSLAFLPAVALTDIVYKIYNIAPPVHFPLESDWLILMSASFINIFFAAGIAVVLYSFLREVGTKHKTALFTSLLGLFSTILFVASKHIYAHTMFTFFYLLSFLLLKKHAKTKKIILLFLSGVSLGIVTLTYNVSFLLTIIPYGAYFLFLNFKKPISKNQIQEMFKEGVLILLGYLPLMAVNLWYFNLISVSQAKVIGSVFQNAITIPIGLLYEGLWGQLFSPGRSFFIYSPILLLPFIYWFKLKKEIYPEVVAAFLIFSLYLLAASLAWSQNPLGTGDSLWHGESSWGPRYLIPAVPFGLILCGYLFGKLNLKEKLLTVLPLAVLGVYVQLLGVVMPFQIKFHNMQLEFQVNEINYPMYLYTNLLPRFSPLINQSKNLVKVMSMFPKTINDGKYNVRFTDGIDFAFNVGPERWRVIDKTGYILFDNRQDSPIQTLTFDLINHPLEKTQANAKISFYLNSQKISEPQIFKIGEHKEITLKLESNELKPKNNVLTIEVEAADYQSFFDKKQIIAIVNLSINQTLVNKESIDVPFLSALGPALSFNYQNWNQESANLWLSWHIHTQVFERTPNFWWLFPLYYWDIPAVPLWGFLAFNSLGLFYFGKKLLNLPDPK